MTEWRNWLAHEASMGELADTWTAYVREASAVAGVNLHEAFVKAGRRKDFLQGSARCCAAGLSAEKFALFAQAALEVDVEIDRLFDEVKKDLEEKEE
jgi:hypothetical protein